MRLVPKNWASFQHYKDRCPPWIRLHRSLLDNKDFQRLPVESRALAPMLWLLASESVDGVINADYDDIAFRLRCDEEALRKALAPLISKGFFALERSDSTTLATSQQCATPETEAERETEAETEAKAETDFGRAAVATKPARKPRSETSKTGMAWNSYATAYQDRYGAEPVSNATVNGQMAQFVGRVGSDEAPLIAAWYLTHNHRRYVDGGHSVGLLLRDAEALRTQWATNRKTTSTQATQADKTQTNFNAFAPLIAKAQEEANAQH